MSYRWLLNPRWLVFIPLLMVLVIGVACGGDEATSTPQPTATPVPAAPAATATPVPVAPAATATPVPVAPAATATPVPVAEPTPTAPPVVAKRKPKYGGIVTAHGLAGPSTWDPHLGIFLEDIQVIGTMYNQLVEFNPLNTNAYADGDIIPDLAESWEMSDDGLSYTFRIRKNAKWTDGRDITADDALFSINRMTFEEGPRPNSGKLKPYTKSVEKIDEDTIRIHLLFPSQAFLPFLAVDYLKILPKHILETGVDTTIFEGHTVGSGPFKAVSFDHGVAAEFEKNVNYFKEGKPYWDGFKIFFITDKGTEIAAFKTERLLMSMDAAVHMDIEDVVRLQKDEAFASKFDFWFLRGATSPAIHMNVTRPPFDNPNIRKAAILGVDRDLIIEGLFLGKADIGGPFGPGNPYRLPEEEIRTYPGFRQLDGKKHPDDIAEAKRLMKAEGYDEDNPLKADFVCWAALFLPDLAQAIVDQLKPIGFDLKLNCLPFGAGIAAATAGDFDILTGGRGPLIPDPDDAFAKSYVGPEPSGANFSKYTDPRVDVLWNKQSREADPVKRREINYEMQRLILSESNGGLIEWGWVTLFSVVNKRIKTTDGESIGPFVAHFSLFTRLKHEHEWLDTEY